MLAFPIAIITGDSELATNMILIAWFGWIVSLFFKGVSPEEKARAKARMAKIKQYEKEFEEQRLAEKNSEEQSDRRGKEPNLFLRYGIAGIIALPFMVILEIAKKYK